MKNEIYIHVQNLMSYVWKAAESEKDILTRVIKKACLET